MADDKYDAPAKPSTSERAAEEAARHKKRMQDKPKPSLQAHDGKQPALRNMA